MSSLRRVLSMFILLHFAIAAQDYKITFFSCRSLVSQIIKTDICQFRGTILWLKINVSSPPKIADGTWEYNKTI